MNIGRLQLGDLVSWKPVDWSDYIVHGIVIKKEIKFIDGDRIMYTVYTQRNECINFFQNTTMEFRMKVESRDVQ